MHNSDRIKGRIIMGGSGSVGSSLLNNILVRHPKIIGGNETSLFSKRLFYTNFAFAKKLLPYKWSRRFPNHGYHLYRNIDFNYPEYDKAYINLKQLAENSDSFVSFCDQFYCSVSNLNHFFWLEKTPANAFLFKEFLDTFPDSYVIHMIRDPYDTILSLLRRGFNPVYAAGIYMLNNAAASRASYHNNYLKVKYEDLVKKPQETLALILDKFSLSYESSLLSPRRDINNKIGNIDSWNHNEHGEIKDNIGTFKLANEEEKQSINQLIHSLKISKQGAKYYGIEQKSLKTIVKDLGYSIQEYSLLSKNTTFAKALKKDRFQRLKKGFLRHFYSYPIGV